MIGMFSLWIDWITDFRYLKSFVEKTRQNSQKTGQRTMGRNDKEVDFGCSARGNSLTISAGQQWNRLPWMEVNSLLLVFKQSLDIQVSERCIEMDSNFEPGIDLDYILLFH